MATRREFLTSLLGAGAMGLVAACGGGALDRQELLDKAFFGVGTVGYGTIAPSHFAYDANFPARVWPATARR